MVARAAKVGRVASIACSLHPSTDSETDRHRSTAGHFGVSMNAATALDASNAFDERLPNERELLRAHCCTFQFDISPRKV
jgi:hypothetical protein